MIDYLKSMLTQICSRNVKGHGILFAGQTVFATMFIIEHSDTVLPQK